jgi:hypothetical protein
MNPKGYNGLRSSGLQVPIGSQLSQDERMRQAIAMEMQALRRELFVRAAAALMGDNTDEPYGWPRASEYRDLANQCQLAARAYFEGLGVIEVPDEQPESDSPATE